MDREVWLPVENFDGYHVSNYGRVLSFKRLNPVILKPKIDINGYCRVCLFANDDARHHVFVHRLVAEAFIPNPLGKPQVNHIDEDKKNNNIDNLEWVTAKENTNYGTRNKRAGETIKKRRHVEVVQMKNGKVIKHWYSAKNAGVALQIDPSAIIKCCREKQKKAGGYEWRYA